MTGVPPLQRRQPPQGPHLDADAGGTGGRQPSERAWDHALSRVLADPDQPRLHAQPIVELTRGTVAGHELLARFPTDVAPGGPDLWFAAAERRGLSAALQARVLRRGLLALDHLPANTFVSINVDPHVIDDDEVLASLASRRRLDRMVLELTEHTRPRDLHVLDQVVADVRARGGLIAVDDAGTGYAGLTQLLRLRPDVVKVDRELVSGVDTDPVKRAMVAMLGDLAGRMDAWLLTEGVETRGELEVLLALGVPLAQGYLFGAPTVETVLAVAPEVAAQVTAAVERTAWSGHLVTLLRPATTTTEPLRSADVLVDDLGRPLGVRDVAAGAGEGPQQAAGRHDGPTWHRATTASPATEVRDAALRAIARPAQDRWAPLVCTDGQGRVVGTVSVSDLVTALAGSSPRLA